MEPSRFERLPLVGRLRAALPAIGLAAACSGRALEWPDVLRDVRSRYPDVPQISVEELRSLCGAEPAPLLLDARAAEEYELGHLSGARLAPDEDAALELLSAAPRDRPVVVYCSVGMRSSDLAERLRSRGFPSVRNLEGGIFRWANEGLPTYRSDGSGGELRSDSVHPYDDRWGKLLAPGRNALAAERD